MKYPMIIVSKKNDGGSAVEMDLLNGYATKVYSENVLIMTLKGQGRFLLNTGCICVSAGTFFYLKKNTLLKIEAESEELYLLKIFFSDFDLDEKQNEIKIDSSGYKNDSVYSDLKASVAQLIECCENYTKLSERKTELILNKIAYQMLDRFWVGHIDDEDPKKNYDVKEKAFLEIAKIIENKYSENLKLKDIADKFYYTSSHLTKLFKRNTGMSFLDYLTSIRLKKAEQLLKNKKYDVTMVSEMTGFPNPRSFQQAFQKEYGIKPSEFRMNYSSDNGESADDHTKISRNIKSLRNLGIFDALFEGKNIDEGCREQGNELSSAFIYENLGTFDLNVKDNNALCGKNTVLNVEDAKDLLLPKVQRQVLSALSECNTYKYISCNSFLADGLQIVFKDVLMQDLTVRPKSEREILFDFSFYEVILDFVKSTGLHMIINLEYMPSILALDGAAVEENVQSCICMPYSMDIWKKYIFEMFSFFKEKYGNWIFDCRIEIWKVPDVVIPLHKSITEEEYFYLYESTYKIIKSVDSCFVIGAPSLTVANNGIKFAERMLSYCIKKNCIPDFMDFTYYYTSVGKLNLFEQTIDLSLFVNSMMDVIKNMGIRKTIPLNLTRISYGFGIGPGNDAAVNMIVPLKVMLKNRFIFNNMGIFCLFDYTSNHALPNKQFCGKAGSLNKNGGKKAIYNSVLLLSKLGDEVIEEGNNYILTVKDGKIAGLIFYDIPDEDGRFSVLIKDTENFYKSFKRKKISFDLLYSGKKDVKVTEHYINYEEGSSYEKWLKELDETQVYSSYYVVKYDLIKPHEGKLHYSALMKPFEVRFIEMEI